MGFICRRCDYKQLKRHLFVKTSGIPLVSEADWCSAAVVTTSFSETHAFAVATLGHPLGSRTRPQGPSRSTSHPKSPTRLLCLAISSGFVPHAIARIPPPADGRGMDSHLRDQNTKLQRWRLDTLPEPVTRSVPRQRHARAPSLDEPFVLPHSLAAAPTNGPSTASRSLSTPACTSSACQRAARTHSRRGCGRALSVGVRGDGAPRQVLWSGRGALAAYNANLAMKHHVPRMRESLWPEVRALGYTVYKLIITHGWQRVPRREADALGGKSARLAFSARRRCSQVECGVTRGGCVGYGCKSVG
ncbi:hypothetical protein PsYK624_158180 [Phanerochaete sordida]|uniref:Uncharacterized protein n=1 Tax=Phanerochaete sordida TaxID=48140 RepID=A0A9P3LLH8_9APHY|nr:hypothetical protein PsYK624_158180 [Phanerochaete sordida]